MDEAPPAATRAGAEPLPDTPASADVRRGWRALAVDLTPLRTSRDFRLLFFGQAVTFAGSMITYVAMPFQVFALTHSSLAVGLLGATELVPLVVSGLLGGAIADALDRRRIVLVTELLLAGLSAVLVANALLHRPRLWVLFAVAALIALVDGMQRPSLEALLPRVVSREQIPAASALSSLSMQFGMILGPAVAGVLISTIGLGTTYLIDVVTFAASLAALAMMRAVPPPPDAQRASLRTIAEGLRYARSRPVLLGTYLVDINAMLFGMPTALFPAIAHGLGGAAALGVLYSAPSVGSFVATVTSGWVARVHHHGRAVVVGAAGWGLAIVAFGLASSLWLCAVMLAFAGAFDMVSGLFRSTIWNQTVPDEFRGRLAGIEMLSYSIGPLAGNVEAGAVASLTTVRISVVSGGAMCIVGCAALGLLLPSFWSYDARSITTRQS